MVYCVISFWSGSKAVLNIEVVTNFRYSHIGVTEAFALIRRYSFIRNCWNCEPICY